MIENSLYMALAASFLFGLPQYKKLIASRKKEVSLGETVNTQYEILWHEKNVPGSYCREAYDNIFEDIRSGAKKINWYKSVEQNFFARKPFTCLLCMTFWLVLARFVFILLLGSNPVNLSNDFAPAFAAPILAEAFTRWFKSLPISF